jgi:hypothetical protein
MKLVSFFSGLGVEDDVGLELRKYRIFEEREVYRFEEPVLRFQIAEIFAIVSTFTIVYHHVRHEPMKSRVGMLMYVNSLCGLFHDAVSS